MLALITLLAFSSIQSIAAWGPSGHEATGILAQSLLTSNGSILTNNLVGDSNTLPNATNWAETPAIKSLAWTAPLHYAFQSVDQTDPSMCSYVPERDCPAEDCLSSAIANFTSQIQSNRSNINKQDNEDAFRFLVHFIGDSMQPLHAGFRSDQGGQSINGSFNNVSTNLHHIWDDSIIDYMVTEMYNSSYDAWHTNLLTQLQATPNATINQWLTCPEADALNSSFVPCSSAWIDESAQYACSAAYQSDSHWITPATSFNLSVTYAVAHWDLIEQRVLQSGVRMAYVINKLADPSCCDPPVVPYVNTDIIIISTLCAIAGLVCLIVGGMFGCKRYRARSQYEEGLIDEDEDSGYNYQA